MGARGVGAGLAATLLVATVSAAALAAESAPTVVGTARTTQVAAAAGATVESLAAHLTCLHLIPGAPPLCTHGSDPAPTVSNTTASSTHPPAGGSIGCYGTGKDGDRVLAYYAYVTGSPDRFRTYAPSIQQWAAGVDNEVNESAAETGGQRHVRWVTDSGSSGCHLVVGHLEVSPSAAPDLTSLIKEMRSDGLDRPHVKYLVWMDTDRVCGQATVYVDSSAGPDNANNGAFPSYARVDRPCWNYGEGHELMHMLGGVQPDAPHATKASHCTDGADIMCYDDGTGATQQAVCPDDHIWRFDCRHDDYFSTRTTAGSWLATHWNAASSAFLAGAAAPPAPTAPQQPQPAPTSAPQPAPDSGTQPTSSPSPEPSPSQNRSTTGSVVATTGGLVDTVPHVVSGLLKPVG